MEQRSMAIAIAVGMNLTAALSAVPVAAVDADCDADFQIKDSETLANTRQLAAGANETGLEDVTAKDGDEKVTVELLTDDDELEFGIFEDMPPCQRSSNVSDDCDDDVQLDTTGQESTETHTCNLEAPLSGSRDFYIVFENVQSTDALDYKVYQDS